MRYLKEKCPQTIEGIHWVIYPKEKVLQKKYEMAVMPVVADEAFPVIADPIDNSDSQILNGEEEVFVGHQGAPDGTIGVYQICSPIKFYSIGFFNHGS